MSPARAGLGSVILVSLLFSRGAAAQKAKPTRAETIFREGREALARGDKTTACAKFEASVELARAPGPLLNLADCEEGKGRLVSAAKMWREGIELLPPSDERRAVAKKRAAALDAKVPKISIRVKPEAADTQVEIDGVPVPPGEANAPLPMDPGNHKIIARSGARTGEVDVSIAAGERKEVTVALGESVAVEENDTPDAKPSHGLRTAGFVAGGVGIVGLAAFGVTAGLIQGRRATVATACNAEKLCTPEGLEAVASGKTLTPINAAALIVGVIGLSAGVTLVLIGSSRSSEKPAAAFRAGGAPGAFSAAIVGTF